MSESGFKLSWTYPNVSDFSPKKNEDFPPRNKFESRCKCADELGIKRVEIPADLIKSEGEEKITKQHIGEIIKKENIPILYGYESLNCDYILHTEPHFSRKGVITELKWNDEDWSKKYIESILDIIKIGMKGKPPKAIEIHPGIEDYSNKEMLLKRVFYLQEQYETKYHEMIDKQYQTREPEIIDILIENRATPKQIICDADTFQEFNDLLNSQSLDNFNEQHEEYKKHIWFAVDIPQLKTTWNKSHPDNESFLDEIDKIPNDRIKCWHIHSHYKKKDKNGKNTTVVHEPPGEKDDILWNKVKDFFKKDENVWYLPEVRNAEDVEETIKFVEVMI